jgi:hypothetical protein
MIFRVNAKWNMSFIVIKKFQQMTQLDLVDSSDGSNMMGIGVLLYALKKVLDTTKGLMHHHEAWWCCSH